MTYTGQLTYPDSCQRLLGFKKQIHTSNGPVGKEAWVVIRPGFLFSYNPQLGNSFLWGLVSAFIKLQEQEKKEKHGVRERDI